MLSATSKFYHKGEIALQTEAGARERTERLSQAVVKDHLIEQHQEFYSGLESLFLSTVQNGELTAHMLSGTTGFLSAPNSKTLRINLHASDASQKLASLNVGSMVGVLGLDFSNRRRNRMHGKVAQVTKNFIDIRVDLSYGNCPKYINTRVLSQPYTTLKPSEAVVRQALNDQDRALINNADLFFIASYFDSQTGHASDGADMSHRGGQPGFVSVDERGTIIFPDYYGNNLFNTFGNLNLNPTTSLLFIDFDTGTTLHLRGEAEFIVNPEQLAKYNKALKLVRIHVSKVDVSANATSLRWVYNETSPHNPVPIA